MLSVGTTRTTRPPHTMNEHSLRNNRWSKVLRTRRGIYESRAETAAARHRNPYHPPPAARNTKPNHSFADNQRSAKES